jgi:hypothetical protein
MNALLFISIGLASGLAIGGIFGAWVMNRKWEKAFDLHHLITALLALKALRADNTERAIGHSEAMLNYGVIGIGRRLGSLSPRRRDLGDVDWLRRAREYRAKYPRTANPIVDLAVAKAFVVLD